MQVFLFLSDIFHQVLFYIGTVFALGVLVIEKIYRPISKLWFVGAAVLLLFVACFQAWVDEHRNTQTVITEKAFEASRANSCLQDRRVLDAYSKGLESLIASQRQTIDKQQQSNDVQQGDVASCVVSLGKMNPKARESIVVVPIPLFTMDPKTGRLMGMFEPHKVYATELIITTNEIEPRFHGYLRCENSFTPISAPQFPTSSQTVMTTSAPPSRITDREYEISTTASGTDWGPSYPAYLRVTTDLENPGKCTFTPQ